MTDVTFDETVDIDDAQSVMIFDLSEQEIQFDLVKNPDDTMELWATTNYGRDDAKNVLVAIFNPKMPATVVAAALMTFKMSTPTHASTEISQGLGWDNEPSGVIEVSGLVGPDGGPLRA